MDENAGADGPEMKPGEMKRWTEDANPPKRAATVAPVVTPDNPRELLLQGHPQGSSQVGCGLESRLTGCGAIRRSVARGPGHQPVEAQSTRLRQPAFC